MLFSAGVRELVGEHTQFLLHSETIAWGLIILGLLVFLVSVLGGICALSISKRIAVTVSPYPSFYIFFFFCTIGYWVLGMDGGDKEMPSQKDNKERGTMISLCAAREPGRELIKLYLKGDG